MSTKTMIISSILYVVNSIVIMSVTLFTMGRRKDSRRLDMFIIVWTILTLVLPAILVFIVMMLEIARQI